MLTRISVLLLAVALGGCVQGTDPVAPESPATVAGIGGQVVDPQEVIDDLLFLREEEKLARDVYLTLESAHGLTIFANISQSEQTHMDAALGLLDKRGIPDPVVDDTIGAFQNELLAGLFGTLVAAGMESPLAALTVGATIEDLDLNDLAGMAARNQARDIARVYDSLSCASRNHLRSFVAQLELNGGTYEAQYLSADDYAEILAGTHEKCGGR